MAGERTLPGVGLKAGWTIGSNGYAPDIETNFRTISALMQAGVKSRTATLPGSPTVGDIYLVKSDDPTNPNKVAIWDTHNGGALQWNYVTPKSGWTIYVIDEAAAVTWNGTAWRPLGGYDITHFFAGKFAADEVVQQHIVSRAFSLPGTLAGSQVAAATPASATYVLNLRKNGASFANITFNTGGGIAITSASGATFAIGDVLSIVAPTTPDATLADVSLTLKGKLV
ncbi:hypothetical protein LOKG_00040 [Loktanella phage pCB2051-A]|uniref:Tail fiber protein n=1 Tax=Loktanella phage pCB2051-A TaxID=754044 RepID=M4QP00_9CAUD|nr:tail fiber protein [Loktanella phage pCB2051-A]AGH31476.1 hypothetical protein LOKG_00040 [Loktanella phage pCB2051-A]